MQKYWKLREKDVNIYIVYIEYVESEMVHTKKMEKEIEKKRKR